MSGRDQHACVQQSPTHRSSTIAALNDALRRGRAAGTIAITDGIVSLGSRALVRIMERVTAFDSFDGDNDPYGEHDFGAFEHLGQRIFWKIDYYSRDMRSGSPNPAEPSLTTRVLTIMLASEY